MFICEYCNKSITTKPNLAKHQKSKKCINMRQVLKDQQSQIEDRFKCKYCDKYLCSNFSLKNHLQSCTEKLFKQIANKDQRITELEEEKCKLLNDKDKEITELKLQIKTIRIETENEILRKDSQHKQEVIERIAEQPRTNTNNNTNSTTNNNLVLPMIDTSQERIERIVHENYTENHFWDGQKGVAHFTKDNLLLDNENNLGYVCTDASRKTFKRKGENGDIIKDLKAIQLTQNISGPIRKKAVEHATNISENKPNLLESVGKKFFDINNIHRDNSGFITELACLTSI